MNPQQRVGLSRFEDLQRCIPRDEVEDLHASVQAVVGRVADRDAPGKRIQVTAWGSYRQGASSCGEIDFILLPEREYSVSREIGDGSSSRG